MAQSEPTVRAVSRRPRGRAPGRRPARLAAALADRRRAAGAGRADAQRARRWPSWAGVNVNTVRAVYARLEDEGLIVTRHGRGSFVADGARGSREVERIAGEAIDGGPRGRGRPARRRDHGAGLGLAARGARGLRSRRPVERRAELDLEPIAAELELDESGSTADEARGAARAAPADRPARGRARRATARARPPREPPPRARAEPRVAGVAELAATRDALLPQLAEARARPRRRPRARERRAREVRDAMVADPAGHRWEVVSAAETGEPGCATWQVGPRLGPLGALMSWWRVKVSGGCPLAAPLRRRLR